MDRVNLSGFKGNTLQFTAQITYQGAPLALTGYTITAVMGTTSYSLTVNDAVNGKAQWTIPSSDTSKPGTYPYHIYVTDSAGETFTALYGHLVIRP